jgi:hypothetical protein
MSPVLGSREITRGGPIVAVAIRDYPPAIGIVALIGSFNVLHNATKFALRGRVRPRSQR